MSCPTGLARVSCWAMIRQSFHCWLLLLCLVALGCSDDEREAQCTAFRSCGGDVDGTWKVGGSCIEGNLKAAATLNPDLPVACQGMYRSVSAAMTGTVSFDAGRAAIDTVLEITADIGADAECASALGLASLQECENLGSALNTAMLHDRADCYLEDTRCNCQATTVITTKEDRDYSIAGSKINYSGGQEYLDYCVSGDGLQARQFRSDLVATVFIDAVRQ